MFLIHDFNWNSAQISWEDLSEPKKLAHLNMILLCLPKQISITICVTSESFDETLIYIVQTFASFYFILDLYLVKKRSPMSFDNLRYFFHHSDGTCAFEHLGYTAPCPRVCDRAQSRVKFVLFFVSCALRYWKFPAMCYRVACSYVHYG